MYECEKLFGAKRGREVHEMIERSIGAACPCLRGDPCPITPQQSQPVDLVLRKAV